MGAGLAVTVESATADRFDDVAAVLRGGDKGCWCLYYRLSSGEFDRVPDRRAKVRELLAGGTAPRLLAYSAGEPVGWCGLGPRGEMGRLTRSRTIPAVDDLPVWSVTCFVVRPGFRRRGTPGGTAARRDVTRPGRGQTFRVTAGPSGPAGCWSSWRDSRPGGLPRSSSAGRAGPR